MAINRGPFNALIDDDGTGTTGTPWNKASIAGVILDPVDAALGALPTPTQGPVRLIGAQTGSSTAVGAANLATFPLSGLAAADTLEFYVDLWLSGPAPGAITVQLVALQTDNVTVCVPLVLTGTSGIGDLVNYSIATAVGYLRQTPQFPGQIIAAASGTMTNGATQVRGAVCAKSIAMPTWTSTWTLYLQQVTGLPAGTPLQWAITLFARKGTPGALMKPGPDGEAPAPTPQQE